MCKGTEPRLKELKEDVSYKDVLQLKTNLLKVFKKLFIFGSILDFFPKLSCKITENVALFN